MTFMNARISMKIVMNICFTFRDQAVEPLKDTILFFLKHMLF